MWPAWVALAIGTLIAFNQGISESQKFANLLGGWARGMHQRARDRNRMDTEEFNKAVRQAVADERERWENDEARALTVVEKRLEHVIVITEEQQKEMQDLSWMNRCLIAYSEYESAWHHKMRLKTARAAANGGTIPVEEIINHIEYYEFQSLCKDRNSMAWRTWDLL